MNYFSHKHLLNITLKDIFVEYKLQSKVIDNFANLICNQGITSNLDILKTIYNDQQSDNKRENGI